MRAPTLPSAPAGAIAIVGMACRYPGADSLARFWQNIVEKRESIRFFSERELLDAGLPRQLLESSRYVRASGVLDDIAGFDAELFGISAREARVLDPQHRIFLECCWHALEDASLDPSRSAARIGVIGGANMSSYALRQIGALTCGDSAAYMEALVGNDKDYLSTRVSYRLNLRGPSLSIGTACSTSLTAVALACQTLQSHACDVILAGGVCISVPHIRGYQYGDGSDALSTDGHCRPFDAAASGTVPGNGAGVVVLKRLEDALADHDAIYAVIRGTGLGNDGDDKVGFWAPSVSAHAETVAEALEFAGVNARDVGYVEAHGTGTPMGDPIELAALSAAFRADTSDAGFCAIGSVKSNIGHTSQAAGVAGLIKAALALHHRTLPPSLHFEQANPKLALETSPFYVNTEARPWSSTAPRRAGVSSLGLGGTNVHVVLEEAPVGAQPVSAACGPQLLPLSAHTRGALEAQAARLLEHLRASPELALAAVASSLQRGRRQLPARAYVVASSTEQAQQALEARQGANWSRRAEPREVVFVFPGASAVDARAAQRLAAVYPVVHETLSEGIEVGAELGVELRFLLASEEVPGAAHALDPRDTVRALSALLVFEVALARLLLHVGIRPAALLGHSAGEYAAACVSGVLDLRQALTLQAGRARLLSRLPARGAMLSVNLSAEEVKRRLGHDVPIAAYNADDVTLLSGHADELSSWAERLKGEDVICQPSSVLGAAHSSVVDPALAELRTLAESISHQAPSLPWISTATGELVKSVRLEPEHWVRQMRQPVRFVQAITNAVAARSCVLLEVGPGGNLTSLIHRILRTRGLSHTALSCTPGPDGDALAHLLAQGGRMWALGVEVDLVKLGRTHGTQPAPLPGYAFEREPHWIDDDIGERHAAEGSERSRAAASPGEPRAGQSAPHLYRPSWVRSTLTRRALSTNLRPWVVLSDGCALCEALCLLARRAQRPLLEVQCADSAPSGDMRVDPTRSSSIGQLFTELASRYPDGAVMLRCQVGQAGGSGSAPDPMLEPAALAQGLAASGYEAPLQWVLLTAHAQPVLGLERISDAVSCAAAAVRVLPRELPNVQARWLDVDPCPGRDSASLQTAACVAAELELDAGFHAVAYRGGRRWVREYRPLEPSQLETGAGALSRSGRYLITGGLGRMGLSLADYLTHSAAGEPARDVRIALTHSRPLPAPERWAELASDDAEVGTLGQILSALCALRSRGAQVELAQVDAGDEAAMGSLVARLERAWGRFDGVFHFAATLEDKAFGLLADSCPGTRSDANRGPKLQGAQVLARLAERHGFGFCCLASSIAAEFGGLGNFGYSVANRALDALAERLDGVGGTRWVSIKFDYYRPQSAEDGRVDPRERQSGAMQRLLSEGALRGRDLLYVIEQALGATAPEVLACGQPIEQHVARFVSSVGKRAQLTGRPDLTSAYQPAKDALQSQLVELWQELLSVSPVGIDDNFFELGGDSLLALRLTAQCRDRLGRNVPVKTLLQSPTIATLAQAFERGEQSADLLRLHAPVHARHTLVCVPYAGGTALAFKSLLEQLPDDCALWVVPALREVADGDALLESVVEQLAQVPTPLSLYGHCGGTFAAVELARRLALRGHPPVRVFAAATLPPAEGVSLTDEAARSMSEGASLHALMQSLGGLPGTASEADAREVVAAMHDDGVRLSEIFTRFCAHTQSSRLQVPLVCLFGTADPLTLHWEQRVADWRRFFVSVKSYDILDAGHYFVHTEPQRVAEILCGELGLSCSPPMLEGGAHAASLFARSRGAA